MGLFDSGRGGMSPAAIALLGLLAVKGFENRDKLAGMLNTALGGQNAPGTNPPGATTAGGTTPPVVPVDQGGLGGLLGGLAGAMGGASTGSVLSGGLGDLVDRFRQAGHGDVAQSWVKDGPNQEPAPQQVEQAVGPDLIGQLAKETGLTREELLARLTHELPKAVDQLTPDGRLPTEQEANAMASHQA